MLVADSSFPCQPLGTPNLSRGHLHYLFFGDLCASPPPPPFPLSKVGTPRWGLQVYDGDLQVDAMSTFIEEAAAADASDNKPLTRLPTVMTRKEPKVKPPPPPPPPPRPEAGATGGAGEGEPGEGAGAYEGMDREKILEQFRAKQAEREAARRKAMDAEVRFR